MKYLHIEGQDQEIPYDEHDSFETLLATEYRSFVRSHPTKHSNWAVLPGGRSSFAGSGTSFYRVTMNGVAYRVTVVRHANGKGFYGTTHNITHSVEA
jgi:hypothetical protein